MFCQGHFIFHGKHGYKHSEREKEKMTNTRKQLEDLFKDKWPKKKGKFFTGIFTIEQINLESNVYLKNPVHYTKILKNSWQNQHFNI